MSSIRLLGADPRVQRVRRMLTRYLPFIATVLAILLVAVFLPGEPAGTIADQTVSELGPALSDGSVQAAERGPAATSGPGRVSVGGVSVGPEVQRPGQTQTGAAELVANCDEAQGKIAIPSLGAPPCVPRFDGTNGGATHQGVTKDKIRVAVYLAEANPAADAILTAAGASDSREDSMQQTREWVQFYEKHFNTWGRKVELVFVEGTGAPTDDAAAKADAIQVATQIKAFASWGSPNNTYVDELTARGVMCMCTVELPNALYQRWAPYVWSTLQSLDQTYQLLTEYIVKRLVGRKAQWAGDPTLAQRDRVFGLLQYDTPDFAYKSGAQFLERELAKHGIKLVISYFNGYPDLGANQEQARPVIQRMREAGVTSLICACDPFAPIFFTTEATRQLYRPEWLIIGTALTDTSFFGRTYDQDQWSHAFGLGQLVARLPETLSDGYKLYTWHFGREPTARAGYAVIRAPIHLFYEGVHMAGGVLTPKTFESGMFALPLIGKDKKTVPAISFGKKVWPFNDYTAFDDVTEIWWDPAARGEDEIGNDGVGMYRYVDGGRRYIPGQWPRTPPRVFDPAGTVTVYQDYPTGEKPPDYPRPTQ